MIEAALIQILSSDDTVLGIIGKATQIAIAGDGEARPYPKLVVDPVTSKYHQHSQGVLPLRSGTVKVHAWAKTPQQAHALADAVESALENYKGVAGAESITGVLLQEKYPRQQELEGKVVGTKDVLYCQTIQMVCNASKAGVSE